MDNFAVGLTGIIPSVGSGFPSVVSNSLGGGHDKILPVVSNSLGGGHDKILPVVSNSLGGGHLSNSLGGVIFHRWVIPFDPVNRVESVKIRW